MRSSTFLYCTLTQEFQLSAEDTPFRGADVKVLYENSGSPDYLIVHLMDRLTWSFETARVDLNQEYTVSNVTMNYTLTKEDMGQDTWVKGKCPDNTVQMVFATCETQIPTAKKGVNAAANIAKKAGFKVKKLLGNAENKAAYRNWLSCNNLILLGRIGHGNTSGIKVSNGSIGTSLFSQANLKDKVLYFNSCQVHNNPLKATMLKSGIKRFVGGICNLKIGTSEDVFKCWLKRVISQKKGMTPAVDWCESSTGYPEPGCHGISGNGNIDTIDGVNPNPDPTPGPDSCVNHCGGRAPGGCYCDRYCSEYNDCCSDKKKVCGF